METSPFQQKIQGIPLKTQEIPLIQHPGASRIGIFISFWMLGLAAILPAAAMLWRLWSFDPLRSLGGLIFLASLALTVWCWARISWTDRGSLWGILWCLVAAWMAHWGGDGYVAYNFSPEFAIQFLQPSLMLFLMGVGIALLCGGWDLVRAAALPLCLLVCANPVPHAFNNVIDLPLQRLSAETARHFAHALGLYPSGEVLTMMFTPHFGMTIVPGCNGVRGASTMAYLALVLGWVNGFRWWRIAAGVVGALVLGYALNLLRLCMLVVYYAVGMRFTWLQRHGEMADYIIGGIIFCIFAGIFAAVFFQHHTGHWFDRGWRPKPYRGKSAFAVLGALAVFAAVQLSYGWSSLGRGSDFTPSAAAMAAVPRNAGSWTLRHTSIEESAGRDVLLIAAYGRPGVAQTVALTMWLSPVQHFAVMSEQAHGRTALWTDRLEAADVHGLPMHMSTYAMADPDVAGRLYYVAESTCRADGCSTLASGFRGRGWAVALGNPGRGRHLVMTVRVEGIADRATGDALARDLLSQMDVRSMVERAGVL